MTAYPYTAYKLTPTFQVRQVTVVEACDHDWVTLDTRSSIHVDHLYPTVRDAITAGEARLAEQERKARKALADIERRRINLKKAKAKA